MEEQSSPAFCFVGQVRNPALEFITQSFQKRLPRKPGMVFVVGRKVEHFELFTSGRQLARIDPFYSRQLEFRAEVHLCRGLLWFSCPFHRVKLRGGIQHNDFCPAIPRQMIDEIE